MLEIDEHFHEGNNEFPQKDMFHLLCVMGCTAVEAVPFSILAAYTPRLLARPRLLPLSDTWPTDWPQLEAEAGAYSKQCVCGKDLVS